MLYFRVKHETRTVEAFNFDITDPKGRAIGANVTFAEGEVGDLDSTKGRYYRAPAGATEGAPVYLMVVQATRGQADYGACQDWRGFVTEAARDAARDKYLDGARKRAAAKAK